MLCQKCGLSEASVHRETTVYRQKIEEHLCPMCAGIGSFVAPPASGRRRATLPPGAQISETVTKIHLVLVDKTGKKISDHGWVEVPKPDHFADHGLRQIEGYASRFVASKAPFASLKISSLGRRQAVSLTLRQGKVQIALIVADAVKNRKQEKRIRDFFASRHLAPKMDYLGNKGQPGETRILVYPLSNDARDLSVLCVQLLTEVYSVTEEEGLDISFAEGRGIPPKPPGPTSSAS